MAPPILVLALLMVYVLHPRAVSSSYGTFLKQVDIQPLGDDDVTVGSEVGLAGLTDCLRPVDCKDIQSCDHRKSGVYRIFPFGVGNGFPVYCDMVTDGGGWLLFQRRQDGSVDFYRNWKKYIDGFGNLYGEFWLGLEKIHLLTSQQEYELHVDLKSYDNGTGWAVYDRFRISGETEKYRLLLGKYTGNIGDSMSYHNGFKFSTFDNENDFHNKKNCAKSYQGAWWYKSCHYSNLNGKYLHVHRKDEKMSSAMSWWHWTSEFKPLQCSEMKIRPLGGQ